MNHQTTTAPTQSPVATSNPLANLLRGSSVEVIAGDKPLDALSALPGDTEIFIANPPRADVQTVVGTAARVRATALTPVPHLAARKVASTAALDTLLARLVTEAGVDRVLVIGGDTSAQAGPYGCALDLLRSGLLEKHAIKKVYFGCYPEGHPRIPDERLASARNEKASHARKVGFDVGFVSQFCFESAPIVSIARELSRDQGGAQFKPGIAGPASYATLLKYAIKCGVGPSLRLLRERHKLVTGLLNMETPERLLAEIALTQLADPKVNIRGVHFFTFGSLSTTADWIKQTIWIEENT